MDNDTESYILLLLADGNLPTGSFVASSGLESFIAHGFFESEYAKSPISPSEQSLPNSVVANRAIIDYITDNLHSYGHSALPFVSDAHSVVQNHRISIPSLENDLLRLKEAEDMALRRLCSLDALYECMTLNEVSRRASAAQGVALLTLLSKGFCKPPHLGDLVKSSSEHEENSSDDGIVNMSDRLKLLVRKEETHGHLPICWGVLTAALHLSLERAQYLHLFLQARSLLSAAIRLNKLGPYAAQQLLLHVVRDIVNSTLQKCKGLHTGLRLDSDTKDLEIPTSGEFAASTWPLGEIIAARHDLLHSRIFNS